MNQNENILSWPSLKSIKYYDFLVSSFHLCSVIYPNIINVDSRAHFTDGGDYETKMSF